MTEQLNMQLNFKKIQNNETFVLLNMVHYNIQPHLAVLSV